MTTAGPLEAPVQRLIERVFNAPVFNRYGSREVGDVACDCAHHTGLHVISPYHIVEVLRPDGTPCDVGEIGELIVTCLTNYSMPLIRFRIGDTGAWADGDCPCGCSWPRLVTVSGRVSDMFRLADGTRIHGEYFTHLFYFLDWVKKFQVTQTAYEHVVIKLVPAEHVPWNSPTITADLEDIQQKIRIVMGHACRVETMFVAEIPPSASGKFRYTISEVQEQ